MHDESRTETDPESEPPRRHPAMRWLRWIVARNPLYPLSAALLLFGINRLSTDPTFLPVEETNLFFNFSALEFYEIMLVGVALLLAHRRIHYDATLLTIIENGLVFVPFVLVTQAVLIGRDLAALLCGAAAVLAGIRFALLRRTRVLLPPRLLALGAVVLLFNLIVPFVYRSRMELDATDWLLPGRWCWLVSLPAFVVLANILEQPLRWSDEPHRQTWLPLLMLGLWISATAVHLRCIDYISGLPWVDPNAVRLVAAMATLLLAACGIARWLAGEWGSRLVPVAASLCLLVAPAHPVFNIAKASPAGLLAIVASFLLFGLGTIAALTRSTWNPSVSRNYE